MLDEILVFSYSGIVIYSLRFLEEEDEGSGERVERGRTRVNVNPIDEVIKLVLLEGKGSSGKYDTEKHRWDNEEEECKCFLFCFVPRFCWCRHESSGVIVVLSFFILFRLLMVLLLR